MPPNPTDAEFITRAINGEQYAFRRLVEQHQHFVFAVSFRLLGNRADAEDVVQETFVRLWKHLSRYRPEVKLSTWLYKIATNLCLDHLRSAHHKKSQRTVDTDEIIISAETADKDVMATEFRMAVREFSAALQPKQKAVFVLRELEGLSVEEVGDILSMSPDAIKSNLYHARTQITKWMKEYYAEKKKLKL